MSDQWDKDTQFADNEMPTLVRFFRDRAREGQAIYLRGEGNFAKYIQRKLHTDIVADSFFVESSALLFKDVVGIEAKIRRNRWPDILLELASCTNQGKETLGWLYTCDSDLLAYAYKLPENKKELYVLYMQGLQNWANDADLTRYEVIITDQSNHTKSVVVPWRDIPPEIILYRGLLHDDGRELYRFKRDPMRTAVDTYGYLTPERLGC